MNQIWSIEKIKDGFERFKTENGRLPMATEIDGLDYLPSSRQIQRKYGGLEQLRKTFGYEDTHFGKGIFRSRIGIRSNIKGRDTELALEKILKEKFGEVFVHTEKIFDNSKNRVDFYIYSPSENFGVDVFYTETIRNIFININIKIDKYKNFPDKLFLVVGNNNFQQKDIDEHTATKRKMLPENIRIINLEKLYEIIKPMKTYTNPLSTDK